jgi:hypothetical protein
MNPVLTTKVKKRLELAPAECWHECPAHAAMYPAWASLSDADQIELGVMWQHRVRSLTKVDQYERLCPECRKGQRAR